jgi:hypothetical protein
LRPGWPDPIHVCWKSIPISRHERSPVEDRAPGKYARPSRHVRSCSVRDPATERRRPSLYQVGTASVRAHTPLVIWDSRDRSFNDWMRSVVGRCGLMPLRPQESYERDERHDGPHGEHPVEQQQSDMHWHRAPQAHPGSASTTENQYGSMKCASP